MLVDLEALDSEPVKPFRSQVCVLGGGVAGLVLTSALVKAGVMVHLLEGGGRGPEERSQSLYHVAMAADAHTGATQGRFRLLGGSSTQWGGQLLPYTDDIFQPPDDVISRGWPIAAASVERYYRSAETLLGVDDLPFTGDLYERFGRKVPVAVAGSEALSLRASKWAPFNRRNVARTLGVEAIASAKATIFTHGNAVELLLAPDGGRIVAVLAQDYRGRRFRFEADQFVLATGTIESSRLMLASRSVAAAGVGNDRDQVGRGFHDHLSYPAAVLTGETKRKMLGWFAPILYQGTTHTAKLEATPALRRRLGTLAVMAHLTIREPEHSGGAVVRGLLRAVQQGDLRGAVRRSLPRLPGASVEIARLAWGARVRRRRAVSSEAIVTLAIDTEQRARPENRITLAERELDALGVPRAVMSWRISADETETIRRFGRFLREELPRTGLSGIAWPPELDGDGPLPGLTDTYHAMGGLLMGTDPAQSVVDPELSVHGVANLAVASCAVFPSGGSSNPTFTLMALTLRLAERLVRELRGEA